MVRPDDEPLSGRWMDDVKADASVMDRRRVKKRKARLIMIVYEFDA